MRALLRLLATSLFLLVALVMPVPRRAHAQAALPVRVQACPNVDADELARLLAIELKTLGGAEAVSSVQLVCDGERVAMRAERAGEGAPLEAELSLAGLNDGSSTRLLALHLSELLATSQQPPVAPSKPEPVVTVEEPPPVVSPRLGRGVTLAASARWQGEPRAWLPGVILAQGMPIMRSLTLRSDLSFELGQVTTSVADVSVHQLTAGVAGMYTLRSAHVDVLLGPGLRCAWAWLAAHDVDAQHDAKSMSAPWLAPFAAGQLFFHGRSPWQGSLGVEGGYVVVPIEGRLDTAETLVAIEGAFLAAQLGAAYRW